MSRTVLHLFTLITAVLSATRIRFHTRDAAPGRLGGVGVFDLGLAQAEQQAVIRKYTQVPLNDVPLNDITALLVSGDFPFPSTSKTIYQAPQNLPIHQSQEQTYDSSLPLSPISVPPSTDRGYFNAVALTDWIVCNSDILYYGPMEFGTPQQILTVTIDTGSADLWVPGSGCADCSNKKFDEGASSTFKRVPRKNKFQVTYGTGAVEGTLVTDQVAMGGLFITNQTFGLVMQASYEFNQSPNDGLLGMAYGSIARSRRPTYFENLIMQGKVAPFFSVSLERGKERGSELCLGCYDATKVSGGISWMPVKEKTYWSVSLDAVVASEARVAVQDVTAAIDTGTSLIYVPEKVAEEFYAAIPGSRPWVEGFFTFPCALDIRVSLTFGGKDFSINPQDFNLGSTEDTSIDCVGGILTLDAASGFPQNLAIVGDEFLKSWYSTYDFSHNGRVGFSPSLNK